MGKRYGATNKCEPENESSWFRHLCCVWQQQRSMKKCCMRAVDLTFTINTTAVSVLLSPAHKLWGPAYISQTNVMGPNGLCSVRVGDPTVRVQTNLPMNTHVLVRVDFQVPQENKCSSVSAQLTDGCVHMLIMSLVLGSDNTDSDNQFLNPQHLSNCPLVLIHCLSPLFVCFFSPSLFLHRVLECSEVLVLWEFLRGDFPALDRQRGSWTVYCQTRVFTCYSGTIVNTRCKTVQ